MEQNINLLLYSVMEFGHHYFKKKSLFNHRFLLLYKIFFFLKIQYWYSKSVTIGLGAYVYKAVMANFFSCASQKFTNNFYLVHCNVPYYFFWKNILQHLKVFFMNVNPSRSWQFFVFVFMSKKRILNQKFYLTKYVFFL